MSDLTGMEWAQIVLWVFAGVVAGLHLGMWIGTDVLHKKGLLP